MRKAYINDWIYGPRRSEYQTTIFRPHMTGSGPTQKQSALDELVDQVIANGIPRPNQNNDTQLMYKGKPIYDMPDGREVYDIPWFDFDVDNALMWVGPNNIIHVTNGSINDNNGVYSRAAQMIISAFPQNKIRFLGTVTQKQFVRKCTMWSKGLKMKFNIPNDNKIFHTLNSQYVTPAQMTQLPNMFWVKMPGKNEHYPILVIHDEISEDSEQYKEYLRAFNVKKPQVWHVSKCMDYFQEHKKDEETILTKVKSFVGRHKALVASLGAIGALAGLGIAMYSVNPGAVATAAGAIGTAAGKAKDAVVSGAKTTYDTGKDLAGKAYDATKKGVTSAYNSAKSGVQKAYDYVKENKDKAYENVKKFGENVYKAITSNDPLNPAQQWINIVVENKLLKRHPWCVERDKQALRLGPKTKGPWFGKGDGPAPTIELPEYTSPDPESPLLNPQITEDDVNPETILDRTIFSLADFKDKTGYDSAGDEDLCTQFLFMMLRAAAGDNNTFRRYLLYNLNHSFTYNHVRMLMDYLFPSYSFTDRFFDNVFCADQIFCLITKYPKEWENKSKYPQSQYPMYTAFSAKQLMPYNSKNVKSLKSKYSKALSWYRWWIFSKEDYDNKYNGLYPSKEECETREEESWTNDRTDYDNIKDYIKDVKGLAGHAFKSALKAGKKTLEVGDKVIDNKYNSTMRDLKTDEWADWANSYTNFARNKINWDDAGTVAKPVGRAIKVGAAYAGVPGAQLALLGDAMGYIGGSDKDPTQQISEYRNPGQKKTTAAGSQTEAPAGKILGYVVTGPDGKQQIVQYENNTGTGTQTTDTGTGTETAEVATEAVPETTETGTVPRDRQIVIQQVTPRRSTRVRHQPERNPDMVYEDQGSLKRAAKRFVQGAKEGAINAVVDKVMGTGS